MINPLRFFTRKYRNAEMVSYWRTQDSVEAKLQRSKHGHMEMLMKGEKYPFPGYPRGSILFGKLSKLKHEIKNQIFNTAWNLLEMGTSEEEVRSYLKQAWLDIFILAETMKYDFPPPERLVPAIKELHRSMTVAGVDPRIRDIICLILHEDDAYRFRFQWLVKFFPRWRKPRLEDFAAACGMAEHAEMIGDMKERQRLFKRIMLLMADGSPVFEKFLKETKWRRVRLSKADKYFFRAKYFKVDFPEHQY